MVAKEERPGLLDELRQRQRDLLRTVGPGALVTLVAFAVAFYFVEPPPPDTVTIATGQSDGRYFQFAEAYAESLARSGVTLTVRETAGSVENFELLKNDASVHLAIVQGGTAPVGSSGDAQRIEAIATLYFEPLWVFHRGDLPLSDLSGLSGRRIAVGEPGSGSHMLALEMLSANGVTDGHDGTQFLTHSAADAAAALERGELDAALFVLGGDAPLIHRLLRQPDIAVLDFARQKAYSRRFPWLKSVVLEQGVIDFEQNLPRSAVRLVAPAASLVATQNLHEAFVPLLLEAAVEQHQHSGLFSDDGELPSLDYVSFPPNASARHYLKHGPSFFQRHLSFWIASLIDRTKIMIIPLLTLLIPLFKVAPPLYRWRIRSRIYRWYGVLRRLDQQLRNDTPTNTAELESTLEAMSLELENVDVPLSYMEEFYHLRLHVDLVRAELARRRTPAAETPSESPYQPPGESARPAPGGSRPDSQDTPSAES